MLQYLFFAGILAASANAQDIIETLAAPDSETVVFGEAQNADGTTNEVLLEQPQNAGNPLGNPITDDTTSTAGTNAVQPLTTKNMPLTLGVAQNSLQNPTDSQMTPEQMNNEIQNKIYQEGNRIYDVQSYPADDLKTVNQNGQNEAITNYPAY